MSQVNRLAIEEIDRDRFARIAEVSLEGKRILTPNYCPLIQNERELNIYLDRRLSSKDNEHLGMFIMRIFDAYDVLLPWIRVRNQVNLESKPIPNLYDDFFSKTISIIDPATEYLEYEFYFNKFLQTSEKVRFPRPVMSYLKARENIKENSTSRAYEDWKDKQYKEFWHNLDRNPRQRNDLIADYFNLESRFETKILIPPVPIIKNLSLLDIALRINDISKVLAIGRGECATYLLIAKSVLGKKEIIDRIIQYLRHDPSKLTIFKFKNLRLWETGNFDERQVFRDLMYEMSEIKKYRKEKLFMLLESSFQSFPSASYGFDIVSSSMRLLDEDSAYGHSAYGAYFDEDVLWNIPYEKLPEIMSNNGGHLPCSCNDCRKITIDKLKKLTEDEWYEIRRRHSLFSMNNLMKMIYRAVKEKHADLIRQKIINSEIRNLQDLIPFF